MTRQTIADLTPALVALARKDGIHSVLLQVAAALGREILTESEHPLEVEALLVEAASKSIHEQLAEIDGDAAVQAVGDTVSRALKMIRDIE